MTACCWPEQAGPLAKNTFPSPVRSGHVFDFTRSKEPIHAKPAPHWTISWEATKLLEKVRLATPIPTE
jgi:hypothetical protein